MQHKTVEITNKDYQFIIIISHEDNQETYFVIEIKTTYSAESPARSTVTL